MIIQALVEHYEDLLKRNEVPRDGWEQLKVSYALCLNADGELIQVLPTKSEQVVGKKSVLMPRSMVVPAHCKRSSGVAPNFLCDNSSYMLGVDDKGKPDRTLRCFDESKKLHEEILKGVDSPGAKALLRFFESWNPQLAHENSLLQEFWDDVISGCNLVFRYDEDQCFLQDVTELADAWNERYFSTSDVVEMVCLASGRKTGIEAVHPAIKGVRGAQSSGAALVSFNCDAFCSYGKKQNYNAPISKYAAFAYTTALNHLIADRDHVQYIGDTAMLCWVSGAEPAYQGLYKMMLTESSEKYSQRDIWDKAARLADGQSVDFEESRLNPNRNFYVLGVAPNAARLSIRFFLRNSFGQFVKNVLNHHRRLEIVSSNEGDFELPLWKLLGETVNQNSKDKSASPTMAGEVLRAILLDRRYPATLLNGVNLRIHAEKEVTSGRAAIIKAYYLKNSHPDVPKEVLQMSLNIDSTNVPYLLGRLFFTLENIQRAANPGINSTIKDKFFNSASATPATVFPLLINLAQKHLRKVDGEGFRVKLEKDCAEVLDKLGETFPTRLSLAQQGAFQLGYYHQRQFQFQGKNKDTEE